MSLLILVTCAPYKIYSFDDADADTAVLFHLHFYVFFLLLIIFDKGI